MASPNTSCINALEENTKEVYLETTALLLKVADNILRNPTNSQYRILKLSNPTVANKILPAIGAMECLFSMGFEEGDDCLVLPPNSSLKNLKCFRDEVSTSRDKHVMSLSVSKTEKTQRSQPTNALQPSTSRQSETPARVVPILRLNTFLEKIETNFQLVLQYENKLLQTKARNMIPIHELEIAAMKKLRKLQLAIKQGSKEQEIDIRDLVLIELLHWFKNSFFTWVDAPKCDYCCGTTKFSGHSTDPREILETSRVEVFQCSTCKRRTLFPRYNDVAKLLQTRRGRCGEWANCFTLFCRAIGREARHVVDEDDHVWTEIYSQTQGRWLHCDPCENVCDDPLMYENGWGKKLSYVMAYSRDDIQDVTWRYSSNHPAVLTRRSACSEDELLATILRLRRSRQANLSVARRAYLERRALSELVEFLTAKHPTDIQHGGRSSGSVAWRLARGEIGDLAVAKPYVWMPIEEELKRGEMQITYSASRDQYCRTLLSDGCSKKSMLGWQNGAFEIKDVLRKEEKDWKKVYLARKDGIDVSLVKWKFDLSEQENVVDTVRVTCHSDVYESGKVLWLLCSEETCVCVQGGSTFETRELSGASSVTLSAELSGGHGTNAWQHTQLFRQDIEDKSCPLDVSITFRKK